MTAVFSTTVVVLMCGLPASGKSSLAKGLVSKCESENWDVSHIEYDEVEDSLLADYQNKTAVVDEGNSSQDNDNDYTRNVWKQSRSKSLHVFQTKLYQGQYPPNSDHQSNNTKIILLDDNFHLRSMRREVYRICQEFIDSENNQQQVFFVTLWVDTPKDICRQRNQDRARPVPPKVIERMSATLEPPGKEHWEKCYLQIPMDSKEEDAKKPSAMLWDNANILDFITQKCQQEYDPVSPPPAPVDLEQLEEERRKTRESWLHAWDQRLRSWVGKVAKISRKDTGQANKARKELLQRLRQHLQQSEQQSDNSDLPGMDIISGWFLEEMKVSWTEGQVEDFRMAIQENNT